MKQRQKHIKKILAVILSLACLLSWFRVDMLAASGEMGVLGGISEGNYLPMNIEKKQDVKEKTTNSYDYKEMVFFSGTPTEVKGTITVNIKDDTIFKDKSGSYDEVYTITAANSDNTITVNRVLTLTTRYEVKNGNFKRQVIKNSKLKSFTDVIVTPNTTYTLDGNTATFSKATVEDITPGVTYYNTSISYMGTYNDGNGNQMIKTLSGDIYGYMQPYSRIETQYLNQSLNSDTLNFHMDIEMNPRLEASKTMYYDKNQPFPISFGGTYNQRLEKEATMTYKINSNHPNLTSNQLENSMILKSANLIEKLPVPEGLDFVEGTWSEEDMKKLYSMDIFTDIPHEGMQYEAISRGDYIKALVKAMDIDITPYKDIKEADAEQVFGDVPYNHTLYPYIMAAYNTKLILGVGGQFSVDRPITREEAFAIYIRVIGLERVGGIGKSSTPFNDDQEISAWARKEIVAGYNLGIIKGDTTNNLHPKRWIQKEEAAAIINRLIDYLRKEIGKDY